MKGPTYWHKRPLYGGMFVATRLRVYQWYNVSMRTRPLTYPPTKGRWTYGG